MQEIIEQLIMNWGLLALFVLMVINGSIGIIPSEVVLFLAGIFAYVSPEYNLIHTIMVATIGNLIGAYILYFLGRAFGYDWLLKIKFVRKFVDKRTLDAIARKYRKDGAHWVGIFRCMPVIRSIVSVPAGMIKMPFWIFFVYSGIGMLVWSVFWQLLGYFLGIGFMWLNDYIMWAMIILSFIALFYFKTVFNYYLKHSLRASGEI